VVIALALKIPDGLPPEFGFCALRVTGFGGIRCQSVLLLLLLGFDFAVFLSGSPFLASRSLRQALLDHGPSFPLFLFFQLF